MDYKYIAKIYLGDKEIANKPGDDVDQLHVWMLAQSNGTLGDIHGKIVDNKTNQVVKQFRKCPPD